MGTAWLPDQNSLDPKVNLNNVNALFILFMIQTIFAGVGMIQSCYIQRTTENWDGKKET